MPSPIPESGSSSTSVDRAQPYKHDQSKGCNNDCNTCSSCGQGMKDCNCSGTSLQNNQQVANFTNGAGNGVDMWSGLNLDQLRLEWSGTDPSSAEYIISTSLPSGLTPADLSISVNASTRMLSMSCRLQNHQEQKNQDGSLLVSQDSASYTQRAFTLPDDVNVEGIKATKNNTGGFQIHLPKNTNQQQPPQAQQAGIKQITIQ